MPTIDTIFYENSPEAHKAKIDVPLAIKNHSYGCPHHEIGGFVSLDSYGKCLIARHKENQGMNLFTKSGQRLDVFGAPHEVIQRIYSIDGVLYMEAVHVLSENMDTSFYLKEGSLAFGSPHFIVSDLRVFGKEVLIRAVHDNGSNPRNYTSDGISLTDHDEVLRRVISAAVPFNAVGLRKEFFTTYALIESYIKKDDAEDYLFTTKTELFPAIRKAAIKLSRHLKGDARRNALASFLRQIETKILKDPDSLMELMRGAA